MKHWPRTADTIIRKHILLILCQLQCQVTVQRLDQKLDIISVLVDCFKSFNLFTKISKLGEQTKICVRATLE